MKITFITENNFHGIPSKQMVGRTDVNWMYAMDAYHQPSSSVTVGGFDLAIYIIPKNNPNLSIEFLSKLKTIANKVGIMQEANHSFYQDWAIELQFDYLHFLSNVDFILCHNEIDLKYYSGIFNNTLVFILPSLLIDVNVKNEQLTPDYKRDGVLISGNFTQWYSGIDSYLLACVFDGQIFAPSMGRKQQNEEYIDGIKHIPYTSWLSWLYELSKMKYGVNMMRTYAAGSFSLACGYLGVPCIGYNSLDTQRILFPELSVNEGDMVKAIKIATHLKNNQQFYNHVSAYAQKTYNDNYKLNIFNQTIKEIYETIFAKS